VFSSQQVHWIFNLQQLCIAARLLQGSGSIGISTTVVLRVRLSDNTGKSTTVVVLGARLSNNMGDTLSNNTGDSLIVRQRGSVIIVQRQRGLASLMSTSGGLTSLMSTSLSMASCTASCTKRP
jgi:hypothetical protein